MAEGLMQAVNELRTVDPDEARALDGWSNELQTLAQSIGSGERVLWVQRLIQNPEPDGRIDIDTLNHGVAALTDRRLIHIGHRGSSNWPLTELVSIRFERGGLFSSGAGTVLLTLRSGGSILFNPVKDKRKSTDEFARRLQGALRSAAVPNAGSDAPSAGEEADDSLVAHLARLTQLHEAGALSDAEFGAAKAKILD